MTCVLLVSDDLPTAGLSFRNFRPVHSAALRLIGSQHVPTILIVDDHAAIRTAVRDLFESRFESIWCYEAENGAEAIGKAQKLKPDLIVLDVSMPVMNGFEAAKVLQKILPAVPVFLLTSHYMEATKQAAMQVGIRAVFSKHEDLAPLVTRACAVLQPLSVQNA
jgi:CheY-like chemotaxis protein